MNNFTTASSTPLFNRLLLWRRFLSTNFILCEKFSQKLIIINFKEKKLRLILFFLLHLFVIVDTSGQTCTNNIEFQGGAGMWH